jgi:hypothetical protein
MPRINLMPGNHRSEPQDWSWDDPAHGYIGLYYKSLKR